MEAWWQQELPVQLVRAAVYNVMLIGSVSCLLLVWGVNRYHAWKGQEANEPTPLYALMGVPSLVLIVVTLGSVRLRADEIINPCTLPDIPYWLWLLAGCAWPWPF